MRLIVINDYGSVKGGSSQVAIASLNALAYSGLDVTFISSVPPVDVSIDRKFVRVINFGNFDLLGNPSKINSATVGLWNHSSASQLGCILNEYQQHETVIHLHTWTKSMSSSIIKEILKRRFKLVVTLHDYFSVCPNGGLYNFVTKSNCLVKPMSTACALTNCDSRSYFHKSWRFLRHLAQIKIAGMPGNVKNFIIISDYSRNIFKNLIQPDAKFFFVRNPIDIEQVTIQEMNKRPLFTFIGRLSPEKGALLFAFAANKANINARFVGEGIQNITIQQANPQAEILGWHDRMGVIERIRESRAIVFPSLLHETQGLVVSEAAALGVPAVVSNSCAARESIIDGKTGLLFKAGNVDDLAEKLLALHFDRPMAARLGKAAYERYWSDPSTLNSHVKDLLECYKLIVS